MIKFWTLMSGIDYIASISNPSYTRNPLCAVKYESISYIDAIEKRLKVMDSTALSLCMEYSIPIVVFDLFEKGNLNRIVTGEKVGTLVTGE